MSQELLQAKQFEETLTGQQIVNIFNFYLHKVFEPMIRYTTLVKRSMADLLAQSYNDYRRKINALDKDDTIDLLFTAIVTPSSDIAFECFEQLQLERGLLMQIVSYFQTATQDYNDYERMLLTAENANQLGFATDGLHRSEVLVGAKNKHLSALTKWTRYYIDGYLHFKSEVTTKFIKLSYQESIRSAAATDLIIDQPGLFQNLLLAVGQALDKYNPSKGALPFYIRQWHRHAKVAAKDSHELGQAYTVNQSARRAITGKTPHPPVAGETKCGLGSPHVHQVSFSYELKHAENQVNEDEIVGEDLIQTKQLNNSVITMFNSTSKFRVLKLLLDIPFQLTPEEAKALASAT